MCNAERVTISEEPSWFKSSFSGASGAGACVEVAMVEGGVLMRDTKDRPGTTLLVGGECWDGFISRVIAGKLDRP